MCRRETAALLAGVCHQFFAKNLVKLLKIPGRLFCNIRGRKQLSMPSCLLPAHRKLCMGFYCVGLVTGLILICLFSLLFVENEFDKIRRNTFSRKEYLPSKLNLPTTFIYKQGHLEIVKKEENAIVYKNTMEDDILNLSWVQDLHDILVKINMTVNSIPSPQINLVVADRRCIELLLNWLIAALVRLPEPLPNILVLGLDSQVCELIKPRNISCVHSDPKTFMRNCTSKEFRFLTVYTAPQTRLLAARLISYWGYSFASYDTDAIVLRNPQELYDSHKDVNIIAGASVHWPAWAGERWGFSMCMGAFMIRSGPQTERLWKVVSKTWGNWGSEQDQINRALGRSNILWNHTEPNMTKHQFCQHPYGWEGFTTTKPRSHILLLPPSQFCRGECCDQTRYPLSQSPYVFHGGGGNIGRFLSKERHMRDSGLWFLREDWEDISQLSPNTDRNWLKEISTL